MSEEVKRLKVLVLTAEKRLPDFSRVYAMMAEQVDLTLRVLSKSQQKNLRKVFRETSDSDYDRVLVDLRFKYIHRQARVLSSVSGLVIYEEDACQNYLASSQWQGRFSQFYKKVPHAFVVVTGASVARRLAEEGVRVQFIPKGYDDSVLYAEAGKRDIELGFIGRLSSSAYAGRKALLEQLKAEDNLQLLRTQPGDDYRRGLNRIRIFVSADVGLNEYMAKNFEAMACGCVLLAWRQGEEEAAIGLKDSQHLLLYSSFEELQALLVRLRTEPSLVAKLAKEGQRFVAGNLSYVSLSKQLVDVLSRPSMSVPAIGFWKRLLSSLFN